MIINNFGIGREEMIFLHAPVRNFYMLVHGGRRSGICETLALVIDEDWHIEGIQFGAPSAKIIPTSAVIMVLTAHLPYVKHGPESAESLPLKGL